MNNNVFKNTGKPLIIGLLVMTGILVSCNRKDNTGFTAFVWKTNEPLSIPFNERMKIYRSGNLLNNPSFERGKIYTIDSTNVGYNLEGWKLTSAHVTREDSTGEVNSGRFAIKINREVANETDEKGEGIISDFIRVIPGNYEFTYHVRLKNIHSKNERFGTKLFDAIDVRIEFYDKNKLPLPKERFCPHLGKFINNSYKGYPFSGFYTLDFLDWTKIIGRSYNHPFSEGDVPDEAKYVRVFLGLKGSGTMWVDDVDFRFSKWNFSALERVSRYADSAWSAVDMLVPAPQNAVELKGINYFNNDIKKGPAIIIPDEKYSKLAGRIKYALEKKVDTSVIGDFDVPVVFHLSDEQMAKTSLVFSIGDNHLFKKNQKNLPLDEIAGKNQGYIIHSINDKVPVIFLKGNNKMGDIYAVNTAIQLLNDSICVYHNSHIVDYPVIKERSFQVKKIGEDQKKALQVLANFKMNSVYFEPILNNTKPLQKLSGQLPGDEYQYTGFVFKASGLFIKKNNKVLFNQMALNQIMKSEMGKNISGIRIIGNKSFNQEEKYRDIPLTWTDSINNSLDDIKKHQQQIITWLKKLQQNRDNSFAIQFLPFWYNNEMIDREVNTARKYYCWLEQYLDNHFHILWTGHATKSLSMDEIDMLRFENIIGGKPIYYDNTAYSRGGFGEIGGYAAYYPGKVRMCNIFEPFDMTMTRPLFGSFHANVNINSQVDIIKLISYADYEWNPEKYDPDFCIWKILHMLYGKNTAADLFAFNEAYYGLWDICMKLERNNNVQRNIKLATRFIDEMEILVIDLNSVKSMDNSLLVELVQKKEELKNNYYTILRDLKNDS